MVDELLINRMNQVEVASCFVEASRNRDVSIFALDISQAQPFGPFVICPKEDPAQSYGGIFMTSVPVSWGTISVSALIGGEGLGPGDLAMTAVLMTGASPPAPTVYEDVVNSVIDPEIDAGEVLLISEFEPVHYSDDMAGVPICWARVGDSLQGDTIAEGLMVVGFTLRRLD